MASSRVHRPAAKGCYSETGRLRKVVMCPPTCLSSNKHVICRHSALLHPRIQFFSEPHYEIESMSIPSSPQ